MLINGGRERERYTKLTQTPATHSTHSTHINIHLDSKFRSSQTKPNEQKKCIIILPLSPWFWYFMKPTVIICQENIYIHFRIYPRCGGEKSALQFAQPNTEFAAAQTHTWTQNAYTGSIEWKWAWKQVGLLEPLYTHSNASENLPLQYPIVNSQTLAGCGLLYTPHPCLSLIYRLVHAPQLKPSVEKLNSESKFKLNAGKRIYAMHIGISMQHTTKHSNGKPIWNLNENERVWGRRNTSRKKKNV